MPGDDLGFENTTAGEVQSGAVLRTPEHVYLARCAYINLAVVYFPKLSCYLLATLSNSPQGYLPLILQNSGNFFGLRPHKMLATENACSYVHTIYLYSAESGARTYVSLRDRQVFLEKGQRPRLLNILHCAHRVGCLMFKSSHRRPRHHIPGDDA